jgi:predicted ATPase/DNA-binding XRE family transcriptional regulator
MRHSAPGPFGARLKALREKAGYTQEELATISGLSVHAVSALERGERRRPLPETVRALSAALDLAGPARDALLGSARRLDVSTDTPEVARLPLPMTAFVGRDADMQTLRRWLDDSAIRLVTLVGSGGVGKTRLALQLAHMVAEQGSTRVLFVSLAAIRDSAFVALAIGEALGLTDFVARELPTRARVACEDVPTLLVLDNFEHVLDAAILVAELLNAVPSIRVLATSRAPLRVRGEREYVVGPLELTVEDEFPHGVAGSPAVRLFVQRVCDVRPDFRVTPANGATVAAICRRLDALPLALELAAPWMKVLTAEELLRRLDTNVLLPTVNPRDLPERQQTMNATIAWSYQLLEVPEQRAFRRFGTLPGQFPIAAAAEVLAGRDDCSNTDEALRAAAGLIDKSLLLRAETSVIATSPQYNMLETVRAYATLALDAAGERDDAMEGLVRHCTREAALAAEALVGPSQVESLNRVREELESYRSVLRWLIDHDRPAEAAHLAWSLMWFWVIRGHAAEGLRWYDQILALPSLSPAVEVKTLVGAAQMSYSQGELDRATTGLDRLFALARSIDDSSTIAHAENLSGHIHRKRGDVNAARDAFSRGLEIFRALGMFRGVGGALNGLAAVALASGDVEEAERLLRDAALVLRDSGPWFQTIGAYTRGVLTVRRGNADEAIALMRESLSDIRGLDDKFALVYALVPLAAAAALKGDDAWAARILGARDAVTDRTGATFTDDSVRDLRERAERGARTRLGAARWAQAYAVGRKMSIDSLLNDIDRASSRAAPS